LASLTTARLTVVILSQDHVCVEGHFLGHKPLNLMMILPEMEQWERAASFGRKVIFW
jgi:hypothetical protein